MPLTVTWCGFGSTSFPRRSASVSGSRRNVSGGERLRRADTYRRSSPQCWHWRRPARVAAPQCQHVRSALGSFRRNSASTPTAPEMTNMRRPTSPRTMISRKPNTAQAASENMMFTLPGLTSRGAADYLPTVFGPQYDSASRAYDVAMLGSPSYQRSAELTQLPFSFWTDSRCSASSLRQSCFAPLASSN